MFGNVKELDRQGGELGLTAPPCLRSKTPRDLVGDDEEREKGLNTKTPPSLFAGESGGATPQRLDAPLARGRFWRCSPVPWLKVSVLLEGLETTNPRSGGADLGLSHKLGDP